MSPINKAIEAVDKMDVVLKFIRESNRIEGILRDPTNLEIAAFNDFMELEDPLVSDMEFFVSIYQPGAKLRRAGQPGVRVGNHIAPPSGPEIENSLKVLLANIHDKTPWQNHVEYEKLHPFTDGNGRSGRMLWAWQMGYRKLNLGFLHMFYYQTLSVQQDAAD